MAREEFEEFGAKYISIENAADHKEFKSIDLDMALKWVIVPKSL
ncbi:MAG: hypothetical protein ACE5KT_05380 [Methanosarcinales archaeon]